MIELLSNIFDSIFESKFAPILGGLCVIWLGYRLYTSKSTKDRRVREFNEAANGFRIVFEHIAATIQQNPDLGAEQITNDILRRNYPKQTTAMSSLYKRLKWKRKCAFRKAWQEYVDPEECGDEPFLSYIGMPYEVGKSFDRQYILKSIEHLISFVNE